MGDGGLIAARSESVGVPAIGVLGPAPAPLARLRGEYRVQVFLKGTRRDGDARRARSALASMPELRRRVTVMWIR